MRGGVFVCHASEDKAAANAIAAALEREGITCWIAPRDIQPGENYTRAILEALAAAPALVLVFSAATGRSPHVERELETAVSTGTTILPVRLEAEEPSPSLRYFIGTSQWLDLMGLPASAWESRLADAVGWALAHPSAPKTPPSGASEGSDDPTVPIARVAPAPAPLLHTEPTPAKRSYRPALLAAGVVVVAALVALAVTQLAGGSDDPEVSAGNDTSSSSSTTEATTESTTSTTTTTTETTSTPSTTPTTPPPNAGLDDAQRTLLSGVGGVDPSSCSGIPDTGLAPGAEVAVYCQSANPPLQLVIARFADATSEENYWKQFAIPGPTGAQCQDGQFEGIWNDAQGAEQGRLRCGFTMYNGQQVSAINWDKPSTLINAIMYGQLGTLPAMYTVWQKVTL